MWLNGWYWLTKYLTKACYKKYLQHCIINHNQHLCNRLIFCMYIFFRSRPLSCQLSPRWRRGGVSSSLHTKTKPASRSVLRTNSTWWKAARYPLRDAQRASRILWDTKVSKPKVSIGQGFKLCILSPVRVEDCPAQRGVPAAAVRRRPGGLRWWTWWQVAWRWRRWR